jgi:hypothetical protein
MPKQLNEREKFLQEIAAMKKVGLLLLDMPQQKRQAVMTAVMAEINNPAPAKRVYKYKKKAARKGYKKAAGK